MTVSVGFSLVSIWDQEAGVTPTVPLGPAPGSFSEAVLDAFAPWFVDDVTGSLKGYLLAIAGTFEAVWDIVTTAGDPDAAGTLVATLTGALSADGPIGALPVTPLLEPLSGPLNVVSNDDSGWNQLFTAYPAEAGATTISISEATPNYAFPVGSTVSLAYVPGWSVLLDPYNCPGQFLEYLAQFAGTTIPPGSPDAIARQIILAEGGYQRGTVPAVISAAQRNLTGSQFCSIVERTGPAGADAYHFLLVVRPDEIVNGAQLASDVNSVKPGGVQWTLIETEGWTIAEAEAGYATIGDFEAAFATISGAEENQLGA